MSENIPSTPPSAIENYLGVIIGQATAQLPPEPLSRIEAYLLYIVNNGTAREAEIMQMIEALKDGLHYKGSVATASDLPTASTSNKGWMYTITANGHEYVSDGTQWVDLSADLANKEDTSNKVTSVSSASTDSQYPSAKCLYDMCGNIESLLAALL